MNDNKKIIGLGLLTAALSGCGGAQQHTQFFYSQKLSEHVSSNEAITKRGGKVTHGAESKIGYHSLGMSVHYAELSGEQTVEKLIVEPLVNQDVTVITPDRDNIDIAAFVERKMYSVSPFYKGKKIKDLSLSFSLGLGMNFSIITANPRYLIGTSSPANFPKFKLNSVKGFLDHNIELKAGYLPYFMIPVQFTLRTYHNFDDFPKNISPIIGMGYEIPW